MFISLVLLMQLTPALLRMTVYVHPYHPANIHPQVVHSIGAVSPQTWSDFKRILRENRQIYCMCASAHAAFSMGTKVCILPGITVARFGVLGEARPLRRPKMSHENGRKFSLFSIAPTAKSPTSSTERNPRAPEVATPSATPGECIGVVQWPSESLLLWRCKQGPSP